MRDAKFATTKGKHSLRLYAGRSRGAAPCPSPRRGRKDKSMQRKTEIVTIRMTPTMKSLVQHLAQKAGMTVTDYMTVCALGILIQRSR